MKSLVQGLQGSTLKDGTSVNTKTAIALTMKHFPGGGPQELGMDPHYSFGKFQQYSGNFAYHLKPFRRSH
jgi:beta-glucosidase